MKYGKKRPKVVNICVICDGKFTVLYARRYKKYCNPKCGAIGQSEKRILNNPGGFKKRGISLVTISKREYYTIHAWIRRNFEKSNTCEICGVSGLTGKFINWANKNGEYNRDRKNWTRLCKKCHHWYDVRQVLYEPISRRDNL